MNLQRDLDHAFEDAADLGVALRKGTHPLPCCAVRTMLIIRSYWAKRKSTPLPYGLPELHAQCLANLGKSDHRPLPSIRRLVASSQPTRWATLTAMMDGQ